jgi:hypothetical protein
MDDDPVLRSLSDDLERDDPGLAAFLTGRTRTPHRHRVAWSLLALPLLAAALLLPIPVALGAVAMLLVAGSPLAVCWLCASADTPTSRRP